MKKIVMKIIKSKLTACVIAAVIVMSLLTGGHHVAQAQAEETGVLRHFKRGDKLPSIKLSTVKDASKQIFKPGTGKPSVIMFFSVRPDFRKKRSLALLSTLSDLADQYKDRLEIAAVFSDNKQLKTVRSFIDKSSINIDVYNDSSKKVNNEFGVFMMPLVVLAEKDGSLHEVIPYTYNMKRIVDGNIKYLLGDLDKDQLVKSLKPKDKELKTDKEKEYIRRINYGRIMYGKKMYGQAIREFSTAIKLMPKLIEAHISLGFALIESKEYDEAEESFKKALKINPESDNAIAGLGLSYYNRGDKEAAFSELEKAFIAPNPRLEVIIALADMYEEKGLNEKAIRLNKLAVSKLMTMYEQRWK